MLGVDGEVADNKNVTENIVGHIGSPSWLYYVVLWYANTGVERSIESAHRIPLHLFVMYCFCLVLQQKQKTLMRTTAKRSEQTSNPFYRYLIFLLFDLYSLWKHILLSTTTVRVLGSSSRFSNYVLSVRSATLLIECSVISVVQLGHDIKYASLINLHWEPLMKLSGITSARHYV